MDDLKKKLKKLVTRRHPEYDKLLPHWKFMRECYDGGRDWFKDNIFKYIKEGESEFEDRLERCYRFNHTREVVDLVDKYLFKMHVARNSVDAPDYLNNFWKNSTLGKLPIDDFMKQVSKLTSIYGRIWIVVDNTKTVSDTTLADDRDLDVRTYAYTVTPENACDMSYDDYNELNWILIHEQVRDDEDPINSEGDIVDRFRLWERNQYTVFTIKPSRDHSIDDDLGVFPKVSAWQVAKNVAELARSGKVGNLGIVDPLSLGKYDVEIDGPYPHEFGRVPVFAADNVISNEPYSSSSMIDDVAYLDRAVANYLSNLDAIIQDQTFSQLVIPAQGIVPGEDAYDKLLEMGTKRAFTYDGEAGSAPQYISPDVRQAEIILKVINKIINEIYHTVGLAGERTKEDNALGIDNSSGVAKAYDFERVNSLLSAKAASLEYVENKLVEFVSIWNGEDNHEERYVLYPENFDVRGLYDEFEIAARLSLIEAPDAVRREQMVSVIDKLFPRLAKDIREKMISELKDWPPEIEVEETGAGDKSPISTAGKNSIANKLVKE